MTKTQMRLSVSITKGSCASVCLVIIYSQHISKALSPYLAGDTASDLFPSDDEFSSSSDDDDDSETDASSFPALSRSSSRSSFSSSSHHHHSSSTAIHTLSDAAAESEFRAEVQQSLERAFAEGHSIDNAAVELKTLRMASNVDLKRVREAVVAAIVEKMQIIPGDAAAQRKEIVNVLGRWGPLIDRIGGVDPVETVEVLQVSCRFSFSLFL
jgi:translation initiation factor eIF-2B subunit epsilon